MKQRLLILLYLFVGCADAVWCQYDPVFSHYWEQETSYNPAAVGKKDVIHASAAYNMTMAGFENAPQTIVAGGDMPFYALNSYHGVGVLFLNDQIGLFSHQRLAAQYAYRHKLFGGMVSVGLQAGLLTEKIDGSDLDLEDPSDPAFTTSQQKGNALDLALGLRYSTDVWYAGLSVQHLTAPTVSLGETNEIAVDPTFYFNAGYNIKLRNPFIMVQPSVFVITDAVSYKANMTCRLAYNYDNKNLYCGVGYSPTNSVTAYVGGSFSGISIGYSYEVYTGAINIGNGSHELSISYETKLDFGKHGKNLHKSVRLL